MKIDFSQPIVLPLGEESGLTLGKVALAALNAPSREPLSIVEAMKRGNLAIRVAEGGDHEITPEEATLIRGQLPHAWAPVVVAIAAKMLEG
ncbi:MAG: hypothetical protein K5872_22300 [Rhizobiaceae bacterium]|nr:hypothetical protein [Rhizobiaceae bacterium]MCV0408953.1 hypothetical protein [Rhizobiaceae bacterium]